MSDHISAINRLQSHTWSSQIERPFHRLPPRQIHLDFHTGPAIGDVGRDFRAVEFAQCLRDASVTSVTVFAKCHHGHLYWDTDHPARHPGMAIGLDLLGDQIEALHAVGIRAPIYLSVLCDEYAANLHPEWIARESDGRPVGFHPTLGDLPHFHWQILDLDSGYRGYVLDQLDRVLRRFAPVDGIFFDMCWDQPSCSHAAMAAMRRKNRDPRSVEDRRLHAKDVMLAFMGQAHAAVQASTPGAGVWFNGRAIDNLPWESPYQEQVEIEALPGGDWGHLFFPKMVRVARQHGKPTIGMTARFHRSWADFGGLKPAASLIAETAQMHAHGAMVSVGDQLHPRGTLDPAALSLIGGVFRRLAEREAWVVGARQLGDVGVVRVPWVAGITGPYHTSGNSDDGVVRAFTQLKVPFDAALSDGDWSRFRVLVLPDQVEVVPPMAEALNRFVEAGGAVIATDLSGFADDGRRVAWDGLGVVGEGRSPYSTTYLRHDGPIATGIPATDHVLLERGLRVRARPGTETFGRIVEPYFERTADHFSSHCQTPPATVTAYPIATRRRIGRGQVVHVPFPLFRAYGTHANLHLRQLLRNLLELVLPDPLIRVSGLPAAGEVTVTHQAAGDDHPERIVVHLLYVPPEPRCQTLDLVEDIVPLFGIGVVLRLPWRPARAYLAPDCTSLPVSWADGASAVTVPRIDGQALVVFDAT